MKMDELVDGGVTRRAAIAGGVAALVAPSLKAEAQTVQAAGGSSVEDVKSQKLRIACIGVGGVGQDYVAGCASEEIVALCDLDFTFAAPAFALYPKARLYRDFREMFDKEAKNFDALIVATPDHWHSHLVLAGIAMGKHIYCAKPMTRTIAEARRVKAACLASSVTTKASIQDSCTSPARATTELLLSGAIGPVKEVHFWTGTHSPSGLARPNVAETPPAGMDWDAWCGPSPERPYNRIYHYGGWRPWWDFGTGNVGDVACHALHPFFDVLEMDAPDWIAADASQSFSATGVVENSECSSVANYIQWHFPARGKKPEMMAYFYDGGLQPPRPLSMPTDMGMPGRGVMFVGEEGVLVTAFYGGSPWLPDHTVAKPGQQLRGLPGGQLLPERKFREFKQPAPTLARCERVDHYADWISACKAGRKSMLPIEQACGWTEFALLGTLAERRYSTPGVTTGAGWGQNSRSDSAIVSIAASSDGHVHAPNAAPPPLPQGAVYAPRYWRSSKVLLWDASAGRVTNDDVANGYVDMAYRKEWDFKVKG
jgi:predicted dehydrogenase